MKKTFSIIFSALLLISISSYIASANGTGHINTKSPFSQQQKTEAATKTVYTCPMHPEVVRDDQGKCPKCGMKLEKKEIAADVYTCGMHPEVLRDKAGKCPKCGCQLEKKEPAKKTESSGHQNHK